MEETGEAIRNICVSGMYTGVSAVISRFGIDPTEFTLLAFGGAGPMLAAFLARELHMKEVLVPPRPGVLSALGGLVADLKNDFIKTIYAALDEAAAETLRRAFAELRGKAETWLLVDQKYSGAPKFRYLCDMRYAGQSFEVETELEPEWIERGDIEKIADSFHREHERLFGHADQGAPVQVVSARLVVAGDTPKPQLAKLAAGSPQVVPSRTITVWLDGAFREAAVYRRSEVHSGAELSGPAIITQDDCTTIVPPGCTVRVDEFGNLRITIR